MQTHTFIVLVVLVVSEPRVLPSHSSAVRQIKRFLRLLRRDSKLHFRKLTPSIPQNPGPASLLISILMTQNREYPEGGVDSAAYTKTD